MRKISNYEHSITELYKLKWNEEELTFRDVIYRLNVTQNKSIREIASELQVSPTSVFKWLKDLGITRVKPKC